MLGCGEGKVRAGLNEGVVRRRAPRGPEHEGEQGLQPPGELDEEVLPAGREGLALDCQHPHRVPKRDVRQSPVADHHQLPRLGPKVPLQDLGLRRGLLTLVPEDRAPELLLDGVGLRALRVVLLQPRRVAQQNDFSLKGPQALPKGVPGVRVEAHLVRIRQRVVLVEDAALEPGRPDLAPVHRADVLDRDVRKGVPPLRGEKLQGESDPGQIHPLAQSLVELLHRGA
mmetsp:Transcript_1701/g.6302  ORF Transcript_1701/g.6302 Transcript_1701/m.6302 type:complete len:227 (+) Transcript_1701:661-1341(+)